MRYWKNERCSTLAAGRHHTLCLWCTALRYMPSTRSQRSTRRFRHLDGISSLQSRGALPKSSRLRMVLSTLCTASTSWITRVMRTPFWRKSGGCYGRGGSCWGGATFAVDGAVAPLTPTSGVSRLSKRESFNCSTRLSRSSRLTRIGSQSPPTNGLRSNGFVGLAGLKNGEIVWWPSRKSTRWRTRPCRENRRGGRQGATSHHSR